MARFSFILLIFLFLLIVPPIVKGADFVFNPNNIITDYDLKDKNSMSQEAIQSFLESYNSILADKNLKFEGRFAAEIIYQAAQAYGISPKFILTKLDHEQCLIRYCSFLDNPTKRQNALDWAAGFSVYNNSSNPEYRGFAKQVDAVAAVQNDYIRKASSKSYIYSSGDTFTTRDGYTITPENQSTANLYTYTPYRGGSSNIGGNYFFAKLWYKYFDSKYYPNGAVFKDKAGNFWLVENYQRRLFASPSIYLAGNDPTEAITVDDTILNAYSIGEPIKFRNYSLVKTEDGFIYLIDGREKRKFKDAESFRVLGFNPEEVITVAAKDLAGYSLGFPIGEKAVYPQSQLVQNKDSGAVFKLANNFLYPIIDKVILKINFKNQTLLKLATTELNQYKISEPIKLKDGVFVKAEDEQIYVISQGNRLPVRSIDDFKILYGEDKLDRIYQIPAAVLNLHPIGSQIAAAKQPDRAQPTAAGAATAKPTEKFLALWDKAQIPSQLKIGQSQPAEIVFKNRGSEIWSGDNIWLEILDSNNQILDLGQTAIQPSVGGDDQNKPAVEASQIRLTAGEQIALNQNAVFKFTLLPKVAGDLTVRFKLKNNQSEYVKGAVYQTKIKISQAINQSISADMANLEPAPAAVGLSNQAGKMPAPQAKSAYQALVLGHNFQPAVLKKWGIVNLFFKVKNTGTAIWDRRRTVLKIYTEELKPSPFYDSNDWFDSENAAVALIPDKSYAEMIQLNEIKTNDDVLFKFTFKVRDLKPGLYRYKILLYEKSKAQKIILDAGEYFSGVMRVD